MYEPNVTFLDLTYSKYYNGTLFIFFNYNSYKSREEVRLIRIDYYRLVWIIKHCSRQKIKIHGSSCKVRFLRILTKFEFSRQIFKQSSPHIKFHNSSRVA